MSGVSFLPYSEHIYKQSPYQDIKKEEYDNLLNLMTKDIDWSMLSEYVKTDMTSGSQELACSATLCEVVDLVSSVPQTVNDVTEIGL